MKTNAQPIDRIRRGALAAAIWANQAESGRTFYSASFQKAYLDSDQQWRNLQSYNLSDLPALATLVEETYRRICELAAQGAATGRRAKSS